MNEGLVSSTVEGSEKSSLLAFLKSELTSDEDSWEDNIYEANIGETNIIKSDEEMAALPLWDPKMGPIFRMFNMEE